MNINELKVKVFAAAMDCLIEKYNFEPEEAEVTLKQVNLERFVETYPQVYENLTRNRLWIQYYGRSYK